MTLSQAAIKQPNNWWIQYGAKAESVKGVEDRKIVIGFYDLA
jgi:hypothetical protein